MCQVEEKEPSVFYITFLTGPWSIDSSGCDCTAMHHQQLFGIRPCKLIRKARGVEASAAGNMTTQASTTVSQEEALEWVKKDKRRLLHVVYRVGDLDKTIKYPFLFWIIPLYQRSCLWFMGTWLPLNLSAWLVQVLHRVLGHEIAAKTWHSWGKIHKCFPWIRAWRLTFCCWTHLQ